MSCRMKQALGGPRGESTLVHLAEPERASVLKICECEQGQEEDVELKSRKIHYRSVHEIRMIDFPARHLHPQVRNQSLISKEREQAIEEGVRFLLCFLALHK